MVQQHCVITGREGCFRVTAIFLQYLGMTKNQKKMAHRVWFLVCFGKVCAFFGVPSGVTYGSPSPPASPAHAGCICREKDFLSEPPLPPRPSVVHYDNTPLTFMLIEGVSARASFPRHPRGQDTHTYISYQHNKFHSIYRFVVKIAAYKSCSSVTISYIWCMIGANTPTRSRPELPPHQHKVERTYATRGVDVHSPSTAVCKEQAWRENCCAVSCIGCGTAKQQNIINNHNRSA